MPHDLPVSPNFGHTDEGSDRLDASSPENLLVGNVEVPGSFSGRSDGIPGLKPFLGLLGHVPDLSSQHHTMKL